MGVGFWVVKNWLFHLGLKRNFVLGRDVEIQNV